MGLSKPQLHAKLQVTSRWKVMQNGHLCFSIEYFILKYLHTCRFSTIFENSDVPYDHQDSCLSSAELCCISCRFLCHSNQTTIIYTYFQCRIANYLLLHNNYAQFIQMLYFNYHKHFFYLVITFLKQVRDHYDQS